MTRNNVITFNDLPEHLIKCENIDKITPCKSLNNMIENYEKSILQKHIKPNFSVDEKLEAAKILKISKATLYRKLSKYDLL